MSDNKSPSSKISDDFLKRIASEKKLRMARALKIVEAYKNDLNSVPRNQRVELGLSSYFLAKQYRYGEGVKPDYALAFECYKFSARLGNPQSCYALGRMYLLGNKPLRIRRNYQLALDYVEMYDSCQCGAALRERLCHLKETIETVKAGCTFG